VSEHAALVSQVLSPSAIEARGPSALQSRLSVSGPVSIRVRPWCVLEVLGSGQLTTVGPIAPRNKSYRSKYRILTDPGIDSSPMNLSAKRAE
jgi:hypothetical protein